MFRFGKLIKIFRLTILGLTLALLLPSPGSGNSSVIAGAKKEGNLILYTTSTLNITNKLIELFNKEYPFIKVGMYRAGSVRFLTRSLSEARAGKYIPDIYYSKAVNLNILRDANLLMKYLSPESKNYREDFKGSQGFWTNSYVLGRAVAYNTRLVSQQEAPKSYEDLLDPKWKGKIGIPMQRYAWFGMMVKVMGEEKALSYFKKLAAQDLAYHNGLTLNASLLAAGEFSILVISGAHTIENLKDQGAPVEWFWARPTVTIMTGSAIAANSPHPNAAKLFVDFCLSKKGQLFLRKYHYIPPHPDVAPNPPRMLIEKEFSNYNNIIYKDLEYYTKLYKTVFPR